MVSIYIGSAVQLNTYWAFTSWSFCRAKHLVKIHVWAGNSTRGPTGICIFEGTMDAELYVEILQNTLVPFLHEVYPWGYHIMHDNNRKHTFKWAIAFFDAHDINWWKTPPAVAVPKQNMSSFYWRHQGGRHA